MTSIHDANLSGQDTTEAYIREFPNQEQVRMMKAWLENHEPGTFSFTGLVDPTDVTVVTPQATVDYGYCWFSLSDGPAIVHTPQYDLFYSVSVFDMLHNIPAVIVNPAPAHRSGAGDLPSRLESAGMSFAKVSVTSAMLRVGVMEETEDVRLDMFLIRRKEWGEPDVASLEDVTDEWAKHA